jgi:hypothetical protein
MASSFDPTRAQREVVTGLDDAVRVIRDMMRKAQRDADETAALFNALAKINAMALEMPDAERSKLARLEAEVE